MSFSSNITVIIPCYNDGAYIKKALHSVVNQTLKADKIIIVDDGSKEETIHVLQQLQIENLELVYQTNQGVSVARNHAIKKATTDFIVTLDADDFMAPTFLEQTRQVLLSQSEVGIVSSYRLNFNEVTGKKEVIQPTGGKVTNFLLKNNGNSNAMFRKICWEQVGGFDENMKAGYEDWEFWLAILKKDWTMEIVPEVLSHYRIKKTSRDKTALTQHDVALRNYILNKHQDVFIANFDYYTSEMIRINSLHRNTVFKYKNSLEYKLGKILLYPFRFLKKLN